MDLLLCGATFHHLGICVHSYFPGFGFINSFCQCSDRAVRIFMSQQVSTELIISYSHHKTIANQFVSRMFHQFILTTKTMILASRLKLSNRLMRALSASFQKLHSFSQDLVLRRVLLEEKFLPNPRVTRVHILGVCST